MCKSESPKISIIMGVFNAQDRIIKSVKSIINQDFQDWELIICDDGSTDNTFEVIKQLEKNDSRIKPIRNEKNRGLAYSLNHCISNAKGDYIARMDDDDFAHYNRLSTQYQFMLANPEFSIMGTSANLVDSKGKWGELNWAEYPTVLDIWAGKSFIHPSVMMRKDALLKSGLYSVAKYAERTEDYDIWCKFYAAGYRGYNLQEKLLDYYEDSSSLKKRKYRYRIISTKLRLLWRKSLGIPFNKIYIAFTPIVIGLIPGRIMRFIRLRRYK